MKFYPPSAIRYYARYLCILLFICIPLFLLVTFPYSRYPYTADDILLLVLISVTAVGMLLLFYFAFLEKCFSYLIIEEDILTWKCPLRKSISIRLSDCNEIGLEYEKAYVEDVYAYIYFVTFPYSQETSKYYGKVKCKEGLVKFRYTNELAKFIVLKYSNKASYSLCKYYREHKKYKLFY